MKSLFDPDLAEAISQRIAHLHSASERQWGTMTVSQTIAHCTAGMEMATGAILPKRAPLPASLLGLLIKPLVFRSDKPMRRNSPSAPELFTFDPAQSSFERERTRLLAAVGSFTTQGPPCCTRHPHPFFGPLTPDQWAVLMHLHLDHHLRQFNV